MSWIWGILGFKEVIFYVKITINNKESINEHRDNNLQNIYKRVKKKVQTTQIKASIKVNEELLRLYWEIAKMIVAKQKEASWGANLIEQVSKDLKREFPDMKGFSATNIKYMRNWYLFWSDENRPQVVDEIFQIPWGHNREIITKVKKNEEAIFYAQQTVENGWSRAVLLQEFKSSLPSIEAIELELQNIEGK